MREGIAIAAFTQQGYALAKRLRALLRPESEGTSCLLREAEIPLQQWTAEQFPVRSALVFIGAAGIAVRTIAPHLKSKAEDPAVLVLDEKGRFVIPLVSGHLGGANAYAGKISQLLGAVPVITTATDLHGAFAVDLWAKTQRMQVREPERIRNVSGKILRGETITIGSSWQVQGTPPAQVRLYMYGQDADDSRIPLPQAQIPVSAAEAAPERSPDVLVTIRSADGPALHLVPAIVTLGIGCRRGITVETLREVFRKFCTERRVLAEAVCGAATIDLKATEDGLLEFCRENAWDLHICTAEALASVPGTFSGSQFVCQTTGVDNVCERSAVYASGGTLLEKKYAFEGVTFAAAFRVPILDWHCIGEDEIL